MNNHPFDDLKLNILPKPKADIIDLRPLNHTLTAQRNFGSVVPAGVDVRGDLRGFKAIDHTRPEVDMRPFEDLARLQKRGF